MRKTLLIACFAVGLLCKITQVMPHSSDASQLRRPINEQLIGRLVSRGYTIEITSGVDGPVYTVDGQDGNCLADHVTLSQLQHSDPRLFDQISPELAKRDVDASLGDLRAIGD